MLPGRGGRYEAEVLAVRDAAPSIAMPRDARDKMNASRGYEDIDPENCWAEWQEERANLDSSGG